MTAAMETRRILVVEDNAALADGLRYNLELEGFEVVVAEDGPAALRVAGEPVALSPRAYELMLALLRRNGAVASRVELLREVWQVAPDVTTRTVDSHMAEVRRKLDDPAAPRHFLTVWKVGYRFRA
ncbi:MAG TPA: DNA-binding response regulator [Gemmatimonadaceae bacterium]|nr:DNA-binding response regulator [Gemmatimonadaceae bacterium]